MSKKYEREIDEIIQRSGDLGPRTPMSQLFVDAQKRIRRQFTLEFLQVFRWVTPTKVGGAGVLLLLAGIVLRSPYITLLSLGVLLSAYFLSLLRGSATFQETTGYEKMWRGRAVDDTQSEGWRDRVRKWFSRKR